MAYPTYLDAENNVCTKKEVQSLTNDSGSGSNNAPLIGLLTSVTDPKGNTTDYEYTQGTDELLSINGEEPSGTAFTNVNDLPKTISRNGTVYEYEYNSRGLVESAKVGTQTLVTNGYNYKNLPALRNYGNGASYYAAYDDVTGNLISEAWNSVQTAGYHYSKNGKLVRLDDNVTGTSYQYDYAFYGLPFRVTGSDGTKTTYDYDRSGKLSSFTFAQDNDTICSAKYYNNEKGNPSDAVLSSPAVTTALHYNYDGFGRLTGQSFGPVVTSMAYPTYLDAENNVCTKKEVQSLTNDSGSGSNLQQYTYTYDLNGNITGIAESVSQTTLAYTYDDLNRLTGESNGTDAYVYAYDAGGNLTSVKKNGATVGSYAYGNTNWRDQLTSFNGKGITYDANGNPLSYDGKTFTWQRATQLSGITSPGNSISYVYDSQGHRVQKTVNGTATAYLYSGDLLVRQTTGVNTLDFRYDSNGNAIGFIYNGADYYYVRNLQGDVVSVVDADGAVVASYTYDAWGNILSATGTMAAINPLRYRGYYYDVESGYYYLNSRYYSPEWRRFINADVLFIAGDAVTGSNMYAYCNDNPVMYLDTEGTSISSFRYRAIKSIDVFTPKIIKNLSSGYNSMMNKTSQNVSEAIGNVVGDLLEPGSEKAEKVAQKLIPSNGKWQEFADAYENIDPNKESRLRSFFPKYLMYLGSGLGAMVLDFHKNRNIFDVNYGNYTTLPGSTQWQSRVGYNWYYDLFFSIGGPTDTVRLEFESNSVYYIVWCWKADYWNLGAGAEIGIYYTEEQAMADAGYYEIGAGSGSTSEPGYVDLKVIVEMDVIYDGTPITENFVQKNWWVTSFTPRIQNPDLNELNVSMKVKFAESNTCGDLMIPFFNKFSNIQIAQENPELSWASTPYKSRPAQHADHKCICTHPVNCSCNNSNYTCCSKPCRYYSDFGDANRRDIVGYDNGFQFYINY